MAHPADRDANQALHAVLDDIRGRYETLRAGLDGLRERLAGLRATAESPDGLVRATVGPHGQLVDLYIDHRGYRTVDADELAHAVVATVRAASSDAADQVRRLVGEPDDLGGPDHPGDPARPDDPAHLDGGPAAGQDGA